MSDKTLKCKDCGADFIFTENEQQFYTEKGFDNEPARCKDCRAAKKARNNSPMSRGRSSQGGGFNSARVSRY